MNLKRIIWMLENEITSIARDLDWNTESIDILSEIHSID